MPKSAGVQRSAAARNRGLRNDVSRDGAESYNARLRAPDEGRFPSHTSIEHNDAPEQLELKAIAKLYGEPLSHFPNDLYIPSDALEIVLEAFEGPLDLLLYLIRRQNFNIFDIPMAELTRQYLAYVEEIRSTHLELAAEYLLMAAMLIDIKSRMLLPVKFSESGESHADPRAELARRLIEYEAIKQGAALLDELPMLDREVFAAQADRSLESARRLPQVRPEDLLAAWSDILRRARLVQHHRISREALSVRETMTQVLRQLQNRRFAEFEELLDPARGLAYTIVTFVALLELNRESLVELTQAECYAPIYVRLGYAPN
jgi:segregation and condensation protein A